MMMTDSDWTAPSVLEHFKSQIADLQQQLNRRIETQTRELDDATKTLREYIEGVDRVHSAQHASLERRVEDGDENLRRHISEQIASVQAALQAQEKLGHEKDRRLASIHDAAQEAIDKAEHAMERRLDAMNEFRDQLRDQSATFLPRDVFDNSQARDRQDRELLKQDISKFENQYLERRVFESTLGEWQTWRVGVVEQLAAQVGGEKVEVRYQDRVQPWQIWAAGAVFLAITTVIIVVVNVLTSGVVG